MCVYICIYIYFVVKLKPLLFFNEPVFKFTKLEYTGHSLNYEVFLLCDGINGFNYFSVDRMKKINYMLSC